MLTDEPTAPSEWSRRGCELGDAGSCLLTSLEDPDALGEQCRRGAANACAWRLETLRVAAETVPVDAVAMAQIACIALAEPVACAAAGKYVANHPSRSTLWHERACRLGYTASCDSEERNARALADEAPHHPGTDVPEARYPGSPARSAGVPGYSGEFLGR